MIAAGGLPQGVSTKPRIKLARGTRTDAAAAEVLTRLGEIAEVNVPGTLDDLDTEFLHDLRVAIRRARSVLRELKRVHDPAAAELRDELKWAQPLTGPMRDLDVQLLEWGDLVALLPEDRAGRARAAARAARAPPRARAARSSARPAQRALRRRARRLAHAAGGTRRAGRRPPDRGGRRRADPQRLPPHGARRQRDRRRQPGRGAARPAQARQGAALPARALRPRVPQRAWSSRCPTLKGLQDVLGRFQDRAVQAELLHALRDELAGGPAAPPR